MIPKRIKLVFFNLGTVIWDNNLNKVEGSFLFKSIPSLLPLIVALSPKEKTKTKKLYKNRGYLEKTNFFKNTELLFKF
jgi:hypothetical protein